ncbi:MULTISPECIES: alpha/beta hydrolase [Niastella]|uniref:Alpha/beta fold hydrolase n=1 Tax=Niastella soli TaxID=2821487 RepID=A0ABS3YLU0_9BACT|nr:alpha/beta fold hydrolase [Niastella soli]MBO9198845.1 alpha/beta fold hydrolase [Niastella soli]
MKKFGLLPFVFLLLILPFIATAAYDTTFIETNVVLHTATGDIGGTLTIPASAAGKLPVALIIAGSGPTDRNGDNPMMKNESLQKLAYGLAANNIASLRFDKRGIGESKTAAKSEADLRFEDYINDARSWVEWLKKDGRFSKVFVAGHSEGSLIGMIAAHNAAHGFVSIAGAGRSADKILKEQLATQPPVIKDSSFPIIDSLVLGKTVASVPKMLFSLFRPSVQPYMISWFHYDPQAEIKKLTIPVLILQGTNDLQVKEEDANLLARSNAKAQLLLIKNMNHIFRIVEGDRRENLATYITPDLPISEELVNAIAAFVSKH